MHIKQTNILKSRNNCRNMISTVILEYANSEYDFVNSIS